MQIGQIALQLLLQLKEFHLQDMILLLLTPQNILVRSGIDNRQDPILLEIVNTVPMLLTHMKNPNSFSYVSGVDRLFLAPELNLCDVGFYNDVWSVGTILYLMVTGGRTGKKKEKFDFKEDVWYEVSEDLKLFIMDMLQVEGSRRATVD